MVQGSIDASGTDRRIRDFSCLSDFCGEDVICSPVSISAVYGWIEVPTIMNFVRNGSSGLWIAVVIAVAAASMSRETFAQQRGLQQPGLEEERDQSAPTDVESEAAKLQKATPEELQATLKELRTARIAALRKAVEALELERSAGLYGATLDRLLGLHAAIAETELEDNHDPVDRIRALKAFVEANLGVENIERAKHAAQLVGTSTSTVQHATAARLKAQTRLAKEILSQKEQAKSLTPRR